MASKTDHLELEHEVHDGQEDWSGGKEPMNVSYGKLMMWYFLLSDAFTFAGLLIAYGALRFSSPSWPSPDFVFSTYPFGGEGSHLPLIFVTIMSFVLIISSVTMVRAVQEGKRENKSGVVFWLLMTVVGGASFLGCQAWEWTNLIAKENMSLTTNPFSVHNAGGVYLNADGSEAKNDDGSPAKFESGDGYLIHRATVLNDGDPRGQASHEAGDHGDEAGGHHHEVFVYKSQLPLDEAGQYIDERGYIHKKFKVTEGDNAGKVMTEEFGPKAFGALFFFITGFHGFHVFSGVAFLLIIAINAASGLYVARKNGYEMVEKIGLYWHFVDLVWVFVFLVFYLL
jgi:cytochrome c oxidase subunit 3